MRTQFRARGAGRRACSRGGYDLVVAADGANSQTRQRLAAAFRPELETRRCAYIWLGTDLVFDAFKFYILDTPAGVMQIHGYPYSRDASTFILEARDDVWHRAGFAGLASAAAQLPPGRSDETSIEIIRELCAGVLGGHGSSATTPGGCTSPRCGARAGGTTTWCCSATPRTPRTSPSARAPSWPWRTPWPWPPACTSSRT